MADRARLEIELKDAAGGAFGAEEPATAMPAGGSRVWERLASGITKLADKIENITRLTRATNVDQLPWALPVGPGATSFGPPPLPPALPRFPAAPGAPAGGGGGGGGGGLGAFGRAFAAGQGLAGSAMSAFQSAGGAGAAGLVVTALVDEVKSVIRSFEGAVRNLVEGMGQLSTALEGPVKVLDKFSVLGGQALQSFAEIVESFVRRGRQLSAFSPELAEAGGMAEFRGTMADLKEAQALGADMARLTDLQSEFLAAFRELVLPIKKAVVEALIPLMETLVENTREAQGGVRLTTEYLGGIRDALSAFFLRFDPEEAAQIWGDLRDRVNGILEEISRRDEDVQDTDEIIGRQLERLRRNLADIEPPEAVAPPAPANFIPRGAFP